MFPGMGGIFISSELASPCPGSPLIPRKGGLKPSVNQILFSFWPGCWNLDAAWLMGRRFSDRSLCSTSAGSDDQSLWKYPGLRSPFGAFVFPTFGTKPTLLPLSSFSCLPHSPACTLHSLSTIPTNCRERFGGEKNQPAYPRAGKRILIVMEGLGFCFQPS